MNSHHIIVTRGKKNNRTKKVILVVAIVSLLLINTSLYANIFVETGLELDVDVQERDGDEFQYLHDDEESSGEMGTGDHDIVVIDASGTYSWNSTGLDARHLKNISGRYYMDPTGFETGNMTINGTDDMELGFSVSWAGDVNGNGYDDLILGAPGYENEKGAAFLFFGYPGFQVSELDVNEADVKIYGDEINHRFGWSVSGAGDYSSEDASVEDIVIGAPGVSNDRGRAYVFEGRGKEHWDPQYDAGDADWTLGEGEAGDEFGHAVGGGADVTGNGADDLFVGAPGAENGRGKVYVYEGQEDGGGGLISSTFGEKTSSESTRYELTNTQEPPQENGVYQISDVEELQWMNNDLFGDYVLVDDIDASVTSGWNDGAGFEPISTFTGTFDGQGHTISDLYIDRPNTNNIGLFGQTDSGATIKNIGLIDVDITGYDRAGSLVGDAGGATIEKSYAENVDVSGRRYVGGLIGYVYSPANDVSDCYVEGGEVDGSPDVGGFTGRMGGSSTNSIVNCYASVEVPDTGTRIGGFMGDRYGTYGTLTGCFWDTEVSGTTSSAGGTGKTTSEMQDFETFNNAGWTIATIDDWEDETWHIDDGNDYPRLGEPPLDVVTLEAEDITHDSAKIRGKLTAYDEEVDLYLYWRDKDRDEEWNDELVEENYAPEVPHEYEHTLTELHFDTTYEFMAVAVEGDRTAEGDVKEFRTDTKPGIWEVETQSDWEWWTDEHDLTDIEDGSLELGMDSEEDEKTDTQTYTGNDQWDTYWEVENIDVEGLDEITFTYHYTIDDHDSYKYGAGVRVLMDGDNDPPAYEDWEDDGGTYTVDHEGTIDVEDKDNIKLEFQARANSGTFAKSDVTVYKASYEYAVLADEGNWTSDVWDAGFEDASSIDSFQVDTTTEGDQKVNVSIGVDTEDDGTINEWSDWESLDDGENNLDVGDFDLPDGYRYAVEFELKADEDDSPKVHDYTLETTTVPDMKSYDLTVDDIEAGESPVLDFTNAVDEEDDPADGNYQVDWKIKDEEETVADGTDTVTFENGIATHDTGETITEAGSYTMYVTIDGIDEDDAFDVDPAEKSQLAFDQQPTDTVAGETIHDITVRIEDEYGNLIDDATDEVTLSIESGSGTLQGNIEKDAVGGIATFDDLYIEEADHYTLKADASGLEYDISEEFEITPADANTIEVKTHPEDTTAGEKIEGIEGDWPEARVTDEFDNPIEDVSVTVTLNKGSFTGESTTQVDTDENGIAEFDEGLKITVADTGYVMIFSAEGVSDVNSDDFEITPADPDSQTITEQPTETEAGVAIDPAPAVRVEDEFGNKVQGVSVTVSLNKGSFTDSTIQVYTDENGVAEFVELKITVADTGYEITFDADAEGVSDVTSDDFEIIPAGPHAQTITVQPTDTEAGIVIDPAPAVEVEDEFGNKVQGVSVTVTLNKGSFTEESTTEATTDEYGVATFDDLNITVADTGYNITFEVVGVDDVTSDDFEITPADLYDIKISPQEASILPEESQTYTATAYDRYDNEIDDVTGDTAWSIQVGAGGGWGEGELDDNVYTAENIGEWIVTGTYTDNGEVYEDTATLTVLGPQDPNHVITGKHEGDRFGHSLAGILSVSEENGGRTELMVGAPFAPFGVENEGESGTGRAYIFFQGLDEEVNLSKENADVTLTGEEENDRFGWSVASAGDVNENGFGDVIVGAPGWNEDQGRSYVYIGGEFGSGLMRDDTSDSREEIASESEVLKSDPEVGSSEEDNKSSKIEEDTYRKNDTSVQKVREEDKGSSTALPQDTVKGGTEIMSTTYHVYHWWDLANMSEDLSANYILENDLDETTEYYDDHASETANSDDGWEPIGDSGNRFTGTFDGQGHTISNLYIDRGSENHVGLFGYVGENGIIKDIGLRDVDVYGNNQVGSLVGYGYRSEIKNSFVNGGSVTGFFAVGGLVGEIYGYQGILSDSYAVLDSVTVENYRIGGLISTVRYGLVSNSYAVIGEMTEDTGQSSQGALLGYSDNGDCEYSYANSDYTSLNLVGWNEGTITGGGMRTTDEMTWNEEEEGYGWDGGSQTDTYQGWDWESIDEWDGEMWLGGDHEIVEDHEGNSGYIALGWQIPIRVETLSATDIDLESATLHGNLTYLSPDYSAEVSFMYRKGSSTDWTETDEQPKEDIGEYELFDESISDLDNLTIYEFRAVGDIQELGLRVKGDILVFIPALISNTTQLRGEWEYYEVMDDVKAEDDDLVLEHDGGDGHRISRPISLSDLENTGESLITWNGTEDSGSIDIYTAVTPSDTPPGENGWIEEQNGDPIQSLEIGGDHEGHYLWLKQELDSPSTTPRLHSLSIGIHWGVNVTVGVNLVEEEKEERKFPEEISISYYREMGAEQNFVSLAEDKFYEDTYIWADGGSTIEWDKGITQNEEERWWIDGEHTEEVDALELELIKDYYHQYQITIETKGGVLDGVRPAYLYWQNASREDDKEIYDDIDPTIEEWINSDTVFNVTGELKGHDNDRDLTYVCDDNETVADSPKSVEFLFHAEFPADVSINGTSIGDEFGHSVSGGSDYNGDGNDDIMVGAPFNGTIGSEEPEGAVYIGFQGSGWEIGGEDEYDAEEAEHILRGDNEGDRYGFSVSLDHIDLTGSGNTNALVGAPGWTRPPGEDADDGRVYILVDEVEEEWPDVMISWDHWRGDGWERDIAYWSKSDISERRWYNFTVGVEDPLMVIEDGDTLLMNITVEGEEGTSVRIYLDSEEYPSHYQLRALLVPEEKTLSTAKTEWARTCWGDSGEYTGDWVAEYSKSEDKVQINANVSVPEPLNREQMNETINVSIYDHTGERIVENVSMYRNETEYGERYQIFDRSFNMDKFDAGKEYMAVVTAVDNDEFDEWGIGRTTARTVKFRVRE